MTRDGWLNIELRHLVALLAVQERASFSAAAAELGYVQSAVSQQVAFLERTVGARLIDRPPEQRAVVPTEAGEVLLTRARLMLEHVRLAREELSALSQRDASVLRLGLHASTGAWLLARVLAPFGLGEPAARLQLHETERDDETLELLRTGRVDLAVVARPARHDGLRVQPLVRDPLVALVAPEHPTGRPLTADELARRPLIGFDSGNGLAQLGEALAELGLAQGFAFTATRIETVKAWVSAGLGVALLPRLVVPPGAVAVPLALATPVPERELVLCHREAAGLSRAASAFARHVLEAFAPPAGVS